MQDQVIEAERRMKNLLDSVPRLHRYKPEDLPDNLDAMADMLANEAIIRWDNAGQQQCPHLRGSGPQPTTIFLWKPEIALCALCAAMEDFATKGTDLDHTCDACGTTDWKLLFYPLGILKSYVAIHGGICERCHDRVVG